MPGRPRSAGTAGTRQSAVDGPAGNRLAERGAVEGAAEHRGALGQERAGARAELVVQADHVVEELGREDLGRALHRREGDPRRGGGSSMRSWDRSRPFSRESARLRERAPGGRRRACHSDRDAEVREGVLQVREEALRPSHLAARHVLEREHHATVAGARRAHRVVHAVAVEDDERTRQWSPPPGPRARDRAGACGAGTGDGSTRPGRGRAARCSGPPGSTTCRSDTRCGRPPRCRSTARRRAGRRRGTAGGPRRRGRRGTAGGPATGRGRGARGRRRRSGSGSRCRPSCAAGCSSGARRARGASRPPAGRSTASAPRKRGRNRNSSCAR